MPASPSRAPLDDRKTPLALRGRALVVSTEVAMLGSVRNPEADVPLLGRLHREHAFISRHDGKYWIKRAPHHQALVAVNECDIQSPCLLEHGDRITLGGHDRRGACELTFLRPDVESTTAVLAQERRWVVAPGGDAFDRVVLMGDYLSVGRSETAHLPAPRLSCDEVRLAWTPAGLAASAAGGAVYEETADGAWEDLPTPLVCPLRLIVAGEKDAAAIFHDFRCGDELDERLELFDPRRRTAPETTRTLPTKEEVASLFSAERQHLINVVRSMSGVRDDGWCEDVVQWVCLQVLQNIEKGEPFIETTLWQYVCWRARNRVIDRKRRGELVLLEELAGRNEEGEPRALEVAGREPSPQEESQEQERFERKKKLLSDILEEYARRCESQPRMLSGREVFERMLRGETAEETAAAMGMQRNAVDKARRDARTKLRELMSKHDVHRTVFQTFYRREMEHPYQEKRKNNGQVQVQTVSELFKWIMDEAGALCPQTERLFAYQAAPKDEAYRDIRYHVEEARCPLCAGLLGASPKTDPRQPENRRGHGDGE